jgi:hypothetical protein
MNAEQLELLDKAAALTARIAALQQIMPANSATDPRPAVSAAIRICYALQVERDALVQSVAADRVYIAELAEITARCRRNDYIR